MVTEDGEFVEDTIDWLAQDNGGNAWYFGEISLNYEEGELADIEGSWMAGTDGGKATVQEFKPETGEVLNLVEFVLPRGRQYRKWISRQTCTAPVISRALSLSSLAINGI